MKNLRWLLPYILKYKSRMILGIIFVTISNFASAYIPKIVGAVIDTIKSGAFSQAFVNKQLLLLILLTLVSGFFLFLTRQTIIYASRLIEYDLRRDLMNILIYQPIEFFQKNNTGNIIAYATNDIPSAREFLGPAIMYGANTITTFIFVLYFMISINLEITLISFLPLPFITYATYMLGKRVHRASLEVQKKYAELTRQSQEFISGIRIIKAYNAEEQEEKYFLKLSKEYYKKNLHLARLQSLFMPVMIVLVGLSFVIVISYGGYEVINKKISIGELTQFLIYLTMLIWPVAAIGFITNLIQRASASVVRLENLFKSFHYDYMDNHNSPHEIKKGNILIKDLSFSYNCDENKVLKNISINIPARSVVGIVGAVGSGKSTLMNLLIGSYKTYSGEIFIDGIELREYSLSKLREGISYVPQDTFLFSTTIRENISFGRQNATEEEIIQAAKLAGIYDEIMEFPDNFDTIVGERGITLSGGQKQRVAIARALLKQAKILMLDDALSAVDISKEREIISNLHQVLKNQTTLITSHRLNTIKDCDFIIVFQNGEISEIGTHQELMELGGYYEQTYQKQMLQEEIEQL